MKDTVDPHVADEKFSQFSSGNAVCHLLRQEYCLATDGKDVRSHTGSELIRTPQLKSHDGGFQRSFSNR